MPWLQRFPGFLFFGDSSHRILGPWRVLGFEMMKNPESEADFPPERFSCRGEGATTVNRLVLSCTLSRSETFP